MRPLRDVISRAEAPAAPKGPLEPLAVLAAVARPDAAFDPAEVFDRSLFGLTPGEVRALGPVVPHLCEVAYEALERSALPMDQLRALSVGTFVGTPGVHPWSSRDGAAVAELIGVPGPVIAVAEVGASALLAVHAAAQAIRAGEVDFALVLGDVAEDGVGAVVLARPERASDVGARVRGLLLGSAVVQPGSEPSAQRVAASRAGIESHALRPSTEGGLLGIAEALEDGALGGLALGIGAAGETAIACVVLGAAEQTNVGEGSPELLGLSARSLGALRALAGATAERLGSQADLAAIASDALHRPPLELRVAVPTGPVGPVAERLKAWAAGDDQAVTVGRAGTGALAFVIPPAGAQLANAGDVLYGSEPVFREALNRCDRALRPLLSRPLLSVLFPAAGREQPIDDPEFANPLTFALAFALAELLRSQGARPSAVLGLGVGEVASAVLAGAMELEPALKLVAERGKILSGLVGESQRALIGATEEQIRELIVATPGVDIVAVPMPDRVVVGGDPAGVDALVTRVRAAGLKAQRLGGQAAHTPLVDPVLDEFEGFASSLPHQAPSLIWISAATGRRVERANGSFWGATLRAPLRLSAAVEALHAEGCTTFVELAPRPTLGDAAVRTLAGHPVRWLSALDPEVDDRAHLAEVRAELWVRGFEIARGEAVHPPGGAELPTYPWDRRPLDEESDLMLEEGTAEKALRPTTTRPEAAWHPDLNDLAEDPDITLVPPDEVVAPVEEPAAEPETGEAPRDLLPTSVEPAPVRRVRPPLEPLPMIPDAGDDDDLSEDSSPRDTLEDMSLELTIDDLPVAEPPPPVTLVPPEPASDADPTSGLLDDLTDAPSRAPTAAPPAPPVASAADATQADADRVEADGPPSMEDIEVDAYAGRATRPLQVAEAEADADVVWVEGWVEDPVDDEETVEPGTWIVLTDAEGVGDYLSTLLQQQGHHCVRVLNEVAYPRDDGTLFVPEPAADGAWEPVLDALGTLHGRVQILHLWALDVVDDAEADPAAGWAGLLGLVRELGEQGLPASIQIVTRGAVSEPDAATASTGGALWGLAGVLAAERSAVFGGIVDLDPDDEDADALLGHLTSCSPPPPVARPGAPRREHAFRGGKRLRRTLSHPDALPDEGAVAADGSWVLCGEVDAPLLDLGQWLAGKGVKRLFLVSAKPPAPEVLRGVLDLQRKGVMCIVVRADLATDKDVDQVRQRLGRESSLGGVVFRSTGDPTPLASLDVKPALDRWKHDLAVFEALTELGGDAPIWLWSEGRALDPVAGGGVTAVVGATLGARLAARGNGTALHGVAANALSAGQAVRLVGRLGPASGRYGLWRG